MCTPIRAATSRRYVRTYDDSLTTYQNQWSNCQTHNERRLPAPGDVPLLTNQNFLPRIEHTFKENDYNDS